MKKRTDLLEGKEYIVVSIIKLYPGFIGTEKWVLISDTPESDLVTKYSQELEKYRPWVYITLEQYTVMIDWKRNEDTHRRRIYGGDKRNFGKEFCYGVDGSYIDKIMEETSDGNYSYSMELPLDLLFGGYNSLTPVQKERLEKKFIDKMLVCDIAKQENVSHRAVIKSIEQGIKKLRTDYFWDEDV